MPQKLIAENASYNDVVDALIESEEAITEIFATALTEGKPLTYADLFGIGIGRRALALSSGFRSMIEQRNSLCALPLVRMQLDTALRLYAGFFVDDHQAFCQEVFHGKQINQIKGDEGQLLHDRYLLKRIATRNQWIIEVYNTTSGYIHFSDRHIKEALRPTEGASIKIVVGRSDFGRELDDYREPMRCMYHLNLIITQAIIDWFARMCDPQGVLISAAEL